MDRQFAREDLGDGIDAVLREVEANGSATITENGRPAVRVVPAEPAEGEPTEAERAAARERLFKLLAEQPIRVIGPWTRDELYERTPW